MIFCKFSDIFKWSINKLESKFLSVSHGKYLNQQHGISLVFNQEIDKIGRLTIRSSKDGLTANLTNTGR